MCVVSATRLEIPPTTVMMNNHGPQDKDNGHEDDSNIVQIIFALCRVK